jgi:TnsA endonuclease N terminal
VRKGIRFTPARLAKWHEQGRGTGTLDDYVPWHQVTRSDPASRGRSHLIFNARLGRQHHFLSDLEKIVFGLAMMMPGIADVQEQSPLALDATTEGQEHFGTARRCDGTVAVARELGVRHPTVHGAGETAPWVMTTDLLLLVRRKENEPERIAVSVKSADGMDSPRSRELLAIEREYWRCRQVDWLLVTPHEYGAGVGDAVRAALPWAVGVMPCGASLLAGCASLRRRIVNRPLHEAVGIIRAALGVDAPTAQAALWQSVWQGTVPLDLSRPVRPSERLQLLSEQAFWQQNPIVARRSAWCL